MGEVSRKRRASQENIEHARKFARRNSEGNGENRVVPRVLQDFHANNATIMRQLVDHSTQTNPDRVDCSTQINPDTVDCSTQINPDRLDCSTQTDFDGHFTAIDSSVAFSGRCLLGMYSIADAMLAATRHTSTCRKGPVQIKNRAKSGLSCKVYFACGCGKQFEMSSNDQTCSLEANEALSWGCQLTATGFKSATALLTTLDLPTPCYDTFKIRQDNIFSETWNVAKSDMKKWAAKEAELATAEGNFVIVNGKQYPAITVVVDGGWAKRSYGHSYSSKCGVAVIIGARTRKVIYADVKITSCSVCDKKRDKGVLPPQHTCYKNFDGPATKMESQILYEGFSSSITEYNLVYHKFIGDGDSSVFHTIYNVYGHNIIIKKIECMNHVVKNLTSRLLEISKNLVKGQGAPDINAAERARVNPLLTRIRTGVRRAIIYNKEQGNHWKDLRADILNVLQHVFGEHSHCKSYFCDPEKKKNERNVFEIVRRMNCFDVLLKTLNRVADMSESLIHAQTSNPAENFMGVVSKYIEGKRKHFGQRYLYKLRISGAILSYNETTFWATYVYEQLKCKSPNPLWAKQTAISKRCRSYVKKYSKSRPLNIPVLAQKGDWDYGSNPRRPDLSQDIVKQKILEKRESLQVTAEQQLKIEKATRLQSESAAWFQERICRITASFAGKIYKLRDTTDNTDILNEIFNRKKHPKTVMLAMQFGKDNEHRAIETYELMKGYPKGTVKNCGLFVSTEHGELGSSPDGLVGSDGIVEVKCPYSLYVKNIAASSWPEQKDASCSFTGNSKEGFVMKNNHPHKFQVIQHLHITNRVWCDYVVWSEKDSVIIRVYRNADTLTTWNLMVAKFLSFWENDVAPELVDSRYERGIKDYYCPQSRLSSREKKKNKLASQSID